MKQGILLALGAGAMLSACQGGATPPAGLAQGGDKSAALSRMEPIAVAAHRCWIASRDSTFRGISFANELDSHSGRPRFLLVPGNDYGGRPLLVVQASGPDGRLETFGPLADGPHGARISGDIARWS